MSVTTHLDALEADGTVDVVLGSHFDAVGGSEGKENPLEALLGRNWMSHHILLNLGSADNVSSTTIAWMLRCHKKAVEAGGELVVHSPTRRVRQMFAMLNIASVLPVASNRDEALRAMRKDAEESLPSTEFGMNTEIPFRGGEGILGDAN